MSLSPPECIGAEVGGACYDRSSTAASSAPSSPSKMQSTLLVVCGVGKDRVGELEELLKSKGAVTSSNIDITDGRRRYLANYPNVAVADQVKCLLRQNSFFVVSVEGWTTFEVSSKLQTTTVAELLNSLPGALRLQGVARAVGNTDAGCMLRLAVHDGEGDLPLPVWEEEIVKNQPDWTVKKIACKDSFEYFMPKNDQDPKQPGVQHSLKNVEGMLMTYVEDIEQRLQTVTCAHPKLHELSVKDRVDGDTVSRSVVETATSLPSATSPGNKNTDAKQEKTLTHKQYGMRMIRAHNTMKSAAVPSELSHLKLVTRDDSTVDSRPPIRSLCRRDSGDSRVQYSLRRNNAKCPVNPGRVLGGGGVGEWGAYPGRGVGIVGEGAVMRGGMMHPILPGIDQRGIIGPPPGLDRAVGDNGPSKAQVAAIAQAAVEAAKQRTQHVKARGLDPAAPVFKPRLLVDPNKQQALQQQIVQLVKEGGDEGLPLNTLEEKYAVKFGNKLNLAMSGFGTVRALVDSARPSLRIEMKGDNQEGSKMGELDIKRALSLPVQDKDEALLVIKFVSDYITPDMKLFQSMLVALVAGCTRYDPSITPEMTPTSSGMFLTRLPTEWRKKWGTVCDLKALSNHFGISKLQPFLEKMEDLQVITTAADVRIRVTPKTYVPYVPNTAVAALGGKLVDDITPRSLPKSPVKGGVPPPPPPPPPPVGGSSPSALGHSPYGGTSSFSSPTRNIRVGSPVRQGLSGLALGSAPLSPQQVLSAAEALSPVMKGAGGSPGRRSNGKQSVSPKGVAGLPPSPVLSRVNLHRMLFELICAICERQKQRWARGEDIIEIEEEEEHERQVRMAEEVRRRGGIKEREGGEGDEDDEDEDEVSDDSEDSGAEETATGKAEKRRRKKKEKKEKKRRRKAKLRALEKNICADAVAADKTPTVTGTSSEEVVSEMTSPSSKAPTEETVSPNSCSSTSEAARVGEKDDVISPQAKGASGSEENTEGLSHPSSSAGDEVGRVGGTSTIEGGPEGQAAVTNAKDGTATVASSAGAAGSQSGEPELVRAKYSVEELVERRRIYKTRACGALVSSIKSEWVKRYGDQFLLQFYMGFFGIKKMKLLLLEVPNCIITGSGGFMRVTTVDHAKEMCDPYPPQGTGLEGKTAVAPTFTTASTLEIFQAANYKHAIIHSPPKTTAMTGRSLTAPEAVSGATVIGGVGSIGGVSASSATDHLKIFAQAQLELQQKGGAVPAAYSATASNLHRAAPVSLPVDIKDQQQQTANVTQAHAREEGEETRRRQSNQFRFHLHRLMYSLIAKVCQEQHAKHLLANAQNQNLSAKDIALSAFSAERSRYGFTDEDFVTNRPAAALVEAEREVAELSKYGVYGLPFVDVKDEWLKMYKVELGPLMEKANFSKIGEMIDGVSNVHIVGTGWETRCVVALPRSRGSAVASGAMSRVGDATPKMGEMTPVTSILMNGGRLAAAPEPVAAPGFQQLSPTKLAAGAPATTVRTPGGDQSITDALRVMQHASAAQMLAMNVLTSAVLSHGAAAGRGGVNPAFLSQLASQIGGVPPASPAHEQHQQQQQQMMSGLQNVLPPPSPSFFNSFTAPPTPTPTPTSCRSPPSNSGGGGSGLTALGSGIPGRQAAHMVAPGQLTALANTNINMQQLQKRLEGYAMGGGTMPGGGHISLGLESLLSSQSGLGASGGAISTPLALQQLLASAGVGTPNNLAARGGDLLGFQEGANNSPNRFTRDAMINRLNQIQLQRNLQEQRTPAAAHTAGTGGAKTLLNTVGPGGTSPLLDFAKLMGAATSGATQAASGGLGPLLVPRPPVSVSTPQHNVFQRPAAPGSAPPPPPPRHAMQGHTGFPNFSPMPTRNVAAANAFAADLQKLHGADPDVAGRLIKKLRDEGGNVFAAHSSIKH